MIRQIKKVLDILNGVEKLKLAAREKKEEYIAGSPQYAFWKEMVSRHDAEISAILAVLEALEIELDAECSEDDGEAPIWRLVI